MSFQRHEDLLNHSTVAEQNALYFNEDREARKARLQGERSPESSEELRAKTAPIVGHYGLVGAGAYSR